MAPNTRVADLKRKRRKLVDLDYADGITAELFAEEKRRFTAQLTCFKVPVEWDGSK